MIPTCNPSLVSLSHLLSSIHNRETALPDFQRDFVWDSPKTKELIESILQNYPAGSLLRIKDNSGFFVPREVAGAPALNGNSTAWLVLDGQQRLTSLYQALYGKGNHRYFMDLHGLLDGGDIEDCVFCMRKQRAKNRFGKIDQQANELVFPLDVIFDPDRGFERWLDGVVEWYDEEGNDAGKELKEQLRNLRNIWIKNIELYQFPVIDLAEETKTEAVCTIFETLNRTGVKLSVFDLLTARFWHQDVRLRDLWNNVQIKHPILKEFDIDAYHILQAIAIFTATTAPSCKRSDVLKLKVDQIHAGWEDVAWGMAEMLHILRNECGIVRSDWLPYNPILIPAGAVLAKYRNANGLQHGTIRGKIQRWFWCSVFGQVYENAVNSKVAKDFIELDLWISGKDEPESVRKFSFEPNVLRDTTPRQRAIYRGCIALILCNGARDFHSGKPIPTSMILEEKIDDHHVFPKGYLADSGEDVKATLRDCVLNRTLIDKKTNIRIGKKAPSNYLNEIESELDTKLFEKVLKTHLLPSNANSPLRKDRFMDFLEERQKRVHRKIKEVTGAAG